jgi:membrane-associated phospholipid phosphatase
VRAVDRRGPFALATAAVVAVAMVAVGLLALVPTAGQKRDAIVLQGFTGLDRGPAHPVLRAVALSVDPVPYTCAGLVLVLLCLAHRRVHRAFAVAAVLVGAGASAQMLKHVVDKPRYPTFGSRYRVEEIGWPSGHAAAATALAICAVIVAPAAWRAAVALVGGACAVALDCATLALTWHYPSEVLGGVLLAGIWGAAGLAALARLESGGPGPAIAPTPRGLIPLGAAGAWAAAVAVVVAAAPIPMGSVDHMAVAACALLIAALTLALLVVAVVAAPPDPEHDLVARAMRSRPIPRAEEG